MERILRPEEFGAKGDCITDDTLSIQNCINYALSLKECSNVSIVFSSVYRTTNTLLFGVKFVEEIDCLKFINVNSSKVDLVKYLSSRHAPTLNIIGAGRAGIYADFPDTLNVKSAIYFSLNGDTRCQSSIELENVKISGMGIYGKGYFTSQGKPSRGPIPENNMYGLTLLYNSSVTVSDCVVIGFKIGILENYSYFSEIRNVSIRRCETGLFNYGSASSELRRARFSDCKKAIEIRASQFELNNVYTTSCPISLHVGAGSVLGSNLYFESNNCGEAQLIIGDNVGDEFYIAGNNGLVDSTTFTMVTIVANKKPTPGVIGEDLTGVSIKMKDSARRLYLNGGSAQSSYKQFANANNKIYSQGVLGMTQNSNVTVLN